MNRPIILLDVDGPLNPFDAKPTRRPAGYTTHRLRPEGYERSRKPLRVWLASEHGPRLLRFAVEHDADLAWATTWQHDANTMIGPVLGLPELPVIEFDSHSSAWREWKYPAVLDFAADRPVVWFDDDFAAVYHAPAKNRFLAARGDVPTLLHHVDPRIGLTELDFLQAGRWLANLRG